MVSVASREFAGALVLGTGVLLVAGYILFWNKKKATPKKSVGKVTHIRIYPIKSGPALMVDSAECTETGLKYKALSDRQFLLVGNNGFISIRKNLKLLQLKLTYNEEANSLDVEAPGMMSQLSIPLQIPEYDPSKVKSFTWFDNRETFYLDYGSQYRDWFTEFLGESCDLGSAHPEIYREVNPEMVYNAASFHPNTKLFFANSHPFMVASQHSLDDLNTRLEETVTMESFRPNIIVTSGDDSHIKPYEEDLWRELHIGAEAILYNARACPRCPMIYVDHENHKMRENKEPMTTLLKYRRGTAKKDKSKSVFGINASLIKKGSMSVGDKMTAVHATSL